MKNKKKNRIWNPKPDGHRNQSTNELLNEKKMKKKKKKEYR